MRRTTARRPRSATPLLATATARGAVLFVLSTLLAAQPGSTPPETDLQRLDRSIDASDPAGADRVIAEIRATDAKRASLLADYARARRLHQRSRRAPARLDVRLEVARQAEIAYRHVLNRAPPPPLTARGRHHLALLLQERARWRLDFNRVLHAVEIDDDLIGSAALFRAVFNTSATRLPDGDAWLRTSAELEQWINLYYRARLYSIEDSRRAPALREALTRLDAFAERHAGTLGEWRAFFYCARCLELYGDEEGACERYRDLLPAGEEWWTPQTMPLLERAAADYCRLARRLDRDGSGARAAAQCAAIVERHARRLGRMPTPALAQVVGEAALAGARWTPTADDAFAWIDRTAARFAEDGAPAARRAFAPFARTLIARTTPAARLRHRHATLLAADGALRDVAPEQALDLALTVARDRQTTAPLRAEGWMIASRAWDRRGFEREAARAAERSAALDRSDETRRRVAALWSRIARRTNAAADVARADRARAILPTVRGALEHRSGMEAYRRGDFAEALAWLERIDATSPYRALALAHAAYARHLAARRDDTETARATLAMLEELDRLPADAPNLLPALALGRVTRALAHRRLGDSERARIALDGIEVTYGETRPSLVAEALTLRLACELDVGDVTAADATLATLESRYPLHRSLGEGALLLGRHLRRVASGESPGGGPATARHATLLRSVRLRRRARELLKGDFDARDHYALGLDELALGRPDRALEVFDRLLRRAPATLEAVLDTVRLARARSLLALDRDAEALEAIDDVLTRRPEHVAPLRLRAIALGGSITVDADGQVVAKPRLGRREEADRVWERLLEHHSTTNPYPDAWFEAQIHRALIRYFAARPDYARDLLAFHRIDHPEFGGERFRAAVAWIEARLGR